MKRPAYEVMRDLYIELFFAYKELHRQGIPLQEIDEELINCAKAIVRAIREQKDIAFDYSGDYSSK